MGARHQPELAGTQGFQVTFYTEQNRRHGNNSVGDWLMELAKSLQNPGATLVAGAEGLGRDKAIKIGQVSTVALVDKGSVVVTLVLAWLLLGEALTWPKLVGGGFIVAGLFVIAQG